MPSEPPPSRYRVVERGRRLEVIDTLSGETTPAPSRSADALGPGSAITTHRWFDDKAPRRLALDPAAAEWLGRARQASVVGAVITLGLVALWPALLLPIGVSVAALIDRRVRTRLRAAITARLDRLDPAA